MKYSQIPQTTRNGLEQAIEAGDPMQIVERMLGLALQGDEPDWLTAIALELTAHPTLDVRKASITTLGHIARVNRAIPHELVVPRLQLLLDDSDLSGRASDALDDIETFAPAEQARRAAP